MHNHKITDIAKALSLSTRRVQQLVKAEILPASINGHYDLVACIRGYEQYLQQKQLVKSSNVPTLATEKLRLLKAQADKAEREVQILEDKYIAVNEAEVLWSNLLIAFRARMLSLPTNIARQLMAAGNDYAATVNILQTEINHALLELSNYKCGNKEK